MKRRRRRTPPTELAPEALEHRAAAFERAYDHFSQEMRGKPLTQVRQRLVVLLREHSQELSLPELELWALNAADPDWARENPEKASRLMHEIEEAGTASPDPEERSEPRAR